MRTLLTLAALAALAAPAAAAPSCRLDKQDYQSLAQADGSLTEEFVGAMDAKSTDAVDLCKSRTLLRKVNNGQQPTQADRPERSWRWLTDDELAIVGPAESKLLADAMRQKGMIKKA